MQSARIVAIASVIREAYLWKERMGCRAAAVSERKIKYEMENNSKETWLC
jgi:hypothetical protein